MPRATSGFIHTNSEIPPKEETTKKLEKRRFRSLFVSASPKNFLPTTPISDGRCNVHCHSIRGGRSDVEHEFPLLAWRAGWMGERSLWRNLSDRDLAQERTNERTRRNGLPIRLPSFLCYVAHFQGLKKVRSLQSPGRSAVLTSSPPSLRLCTWCECCMESTMDWMEGRATLMGKARKKE